MYVAGYTFGRGWIESLRIDPANHFLGLRINVFTSALLFVAAVAFLLLRRTAREDPSTVLGRPSKGSAVPREPSASPLPLEPAQAVPPTGTSPAASEAEASEGAATDPTARTRDST